MDGGQLSFPVHVVRVSVRLGCITLVVVVLNPMRIDPYPRELRLCGLIEFAGIELFNHHHQQQDRNMSRKVTITITHHTTPADYHLDGLSNFNGLIGGIEKDGRWKRIANKNRIKCLS